MPKPPAKRPRPLTKAIVGTPADPAERVHPNWVGEEELLTDDPKQQARLRRAFFKRRYLGFEDVKK